MGCGCSDTATAGAHTATAAGDQVPLAGTYADTNRMHTYICIYEMTRIGCIRTYVYEMTRMECIRTYVYERWQLQVSRLQFYFQNILPLICSALSF